MKKIVDMCCGCAVPGYPCRGSLCERRRVEVYFCDECGEELFIAMALLPLGADIGVNLKCENFEFTVLE